MKRLPLLLFLCLSPALGLGPPWTFHSSAIIATNMGLKLSDPALNKILCMQVDATDLQHEIEVNCSRFSTVPASNSIDSIFVKPGETWSSPPNWNGGNKCYARSTYFQGETSGATWTITVWGN